MLFSPSMGRVERLRQAFDKLEKRLRFKDKGPMIQRCARTAGFGLGASECDDLAMCGV